MEACVINKQDNAPVASAGMPIRVTDMTCGHCVAAIRGSIENAIPGAKVRIDQEARLVFVADADPARIREIIALAGYTPDASPR
ncbi:Heavy-metal-associated domain-containing protein [Hyphomicrobiales bacterium]|nr:Heavy-metal-associated domain-containing protein [Hyphomicrobiales bacterium]CAH1690321.1 Heavy-metal-associated domain-containing protein [Hyphomicrobiales bacterium]